MARQRHLFEISISLPSSKLTISRNSTYKHYAFDIAGSSCMQDACHMNFVIDRCSSRASEYLELSTQNLCLSHASDKTENISLYFQIAFRKRILRIFNVDRTD